MSLPTLKTQQEFWVVGMMLFLQEVKILGPQSAEMMRGGRPRCTPETVLREEVSFLSLFQVKGDHIKSCSIKLHNTNWDTCQFILFFPVKEIPLFPWHKTGKTYKENKILMLASSKIIILNVRISPEFLNCISRCRFGSSNSQTASLKPFGFSERASAQRRLCGRGQTTLTITPNCRHPRAGNAKESHK